MEELRKIERVTKPDLKTICRRRYAGQGLLDQAKEFDDAIGIDGFILTKLILMRKEEQPSHFIQTKNNSYIGTGQEYKDLKIQ